ncbi:MAG: SDR family NAD(P)-dependent oxidoreductase [Deltaproteobacteria bacterium]|nr:SDR family NAD(P)-dependent oxidoreductase [Deltaproteobacteria bacterium]
MATELRLDNRVAIITGAGAGLGRSHALLMAARGAKVVVNDLGGRLDGTGASQSAADGVAAEIRAAGGKAVANYDTVATPEGAQSILKTALDAYGTVDIVVNNAGIIRYKRLLEHTPDDFAITLAVHLAGSYYLSMAAFPIMKQKRYGRFVFTSSSGGMRGSADGVAYGAAKAGVVGVANVMALAGAPYGVYSNVILPNAYTRMTETVVAERNREKLGADYISPLVLYLCSEQCNLNHEMLAVGGGTVARTILALAPGWRVDSKAEFTPEAIHAHLNEIMDMTNYSNPPNTEEETRLVVGRRRK